MPERKQRNRYRMIGQECIDELADYAGFKPEVAAITERAMHELFRSGVRSELRDGFEIVGDAGTVDEAVSGIRATRPDVVLLDVHMGDVIGNLNAKRGHIEGIDEHGTSRVVRALVPLAEMFGYATELRSMTQGRATYSMEFSRYSEVPSSIANELIAKSKS